MAKRPHPLRFVKFVPARNGRDWHAYFDTGNKADGKRVYTPLGLWGSPGFFDRYATLQGHRSRKQAIAGQMTVKALVQAYERSAAWSALAEGTKRNYGYTFRHILAWLGDFPIDDVTRKDVRDVLADRIEGNGTRNMFVKVLGALYKWARSEEMTDVEPCNGVELYRGGEHEPWPADLLDSMLQTPDAGIRLAGSLLYYTGQRIGDVCRLRWDALHGGTCCVSQQKTGKELVIPLHRDLARELANTPKRGLTILADEAGRPLKVSKLRYDLQQWAAERGHKVVPHGLRKNAVNALLEAGCSVAEVASITGQSYGMVEHYSKRVNQKALAEAAIIKMEKRDKSA